MRYEEMVIEGRNAVLEAFRSGKTIDKLFVLDGCQDGPIKSILREARKQDTIVNYVSRERLDQMSESRKHQGAIAYAAAYDYVQVEDILQRAEQKGVVIPKRRAAGLTAAVAKASAGAINYTPVAKVTNLSATIKELKKKGVWFVCADMGGDSMYELDLKGPIGLVVGGEGEGASRLVKENCDFAAAIPMAGEIDSLNASVATGVLAYEIVRQRLGMAVH